MELNLSYLYAALAIMLIVIASDFLKRRFNIDLDNFDSSTVDQTKKLLSNIELPAIDTSKINVPSINIPKINLKKMQQSGLKTTVKAQVGMIKDKYAIKKSTGKRNLVLINLGQNKETVTATLRQITNMDQNRAQKIIDSVPTTVLKNISDREAILNKRALEFVGAKCEIR